ncbi:hypothetical protein N7475_000900 [Penicillium sp. IBT 31633x]|nr:hypothetical protein N7475_000900 [Penicillium sp. IBT 31633x]
MQTPTFINACVFAPEITLKYIADVVQYSPVLSEETLKHFEHRTVNDFLKLIIHYMNQNDKLHDMFKLRGELVFDRPRIHCVAVASMGFEEPIYALLYIPPYCLTVPELVAGLQATETSGIFRHKPGSYAEQVTAMVLHAIIRLFSRMVSTGTRHGYICTGEAFVFLHISSQDPSIVEYYLCVPSQDVSAHGYDPDSNWIRRTALGQVLAFTLQSLAAPRPSHEWHDAALKSLQVSLDDYSSLMPQTADYVQLRPPTCFLYQNSLWSAFWRILLQEIAQPNNEYLRMSRPQGTNSTERPYCTMVCLQGTSEKDFLDENCPNASDHGTGRHSINSQEIIDRLNDQLLQSRYNGFRQLHIIGRTCYLIKATLLSHGYTVLIKATSANHAHRIKGELRNYRDLIPLQGSKIPVCLGMFEPQDPYWYHGSQMRYMLVLSWSGIRTDHQTGLEIRNFIDKQLRELENTLQEHGVIQRDAAYRNVLWNPVSRSLVMIDLEDMKWLQGTVQGSKPCDGPGINSIRENLRKVCSGPEANFEDMGKDPRLWRS